ncbi:hypothetical protein WH47_01992 [Habropoda laboriosa]|uniref:Uncharacterized protein n=1 Tax=Habropoda laboriosa TaxID=597456 RepID=A0A0L7R2M5_9HYME|nr:hypothetical protein WH47_01992 [Habropoda laboriosa]
MSAIGKDIFKDALFTVVLFYNKWIFSLIKNIFVFLKDDRINAQIYKKIRAALALF